MFGVMIGEESVEHLRKKKPASPVQRQMAADQLVAVLHYCSVLVLLEDN
jgi:hypothetical protein